MKLLKWQEREYSTTSLLFLVVKKPLDVFWMSCCVIWQILFILKSHEVYSGLYDFYKCIIKFESLCTNVCD